MLRVRMYRIFVILIGEFGIVCFNEKKVCDSIVNLIKNRGRQLIFAMIRFDLRKFKGRNV